MTIDDIFEQIAENVVSRRIEGWMFNRVDKNQCRVKTRDNVWKIRYDVDNDVLILQNKVHTFKCYEATKREDGAASWPTDIIEIVGQH